MNRDETVALFLQGREAWNAWAEKMLGCRHAQDKKDRWRLLRRHTFESREEWRQRHAPEIRAWLQLARADFAGLQITTQPLIPQESKSTEPEIGHYRLKASDHLIAASGNWIDFRHYLFPGEADFTEVTLLGLAAFDYGRFEGPVWCRHSHFQATRFNGASFSQVAWFRGATFVNDINLTDAHFGSEADFTAIDVKRGFELQRSSFDYVPNFNQAHFAEAPRLDNVKIIGYTAEGVVSNIWQRIWNADRDIPARWRALKRLAIQGHDTDRELEFHAREVRSQRFGDDLPVPWPPLQGKAWGGFFRFWFGIFYQIASDFGRSLARPLAFWALAVALGAAVYVSQSPTMIEARHKQEAKGASTFSAAASRAWHAWLSKTVPCYGGQATPPKDKNGDTPVYIGALSPSLASGADLANEAWHLAFRNAFIVLDGSAEAAHRTYGCLYGVELYGGSNPLAVVPGAVSTASAAQKLFSALMIFLFGLALRNMLKMK